MSALAAFLAWFWRDAALHLWGTACFLAVLAALAPLLRRSSARLLAALYWAGVVKLLLPLPLLGPISGRLLAAGAGPVTADEGTAWLITVLVHPAGIGAPVPAAAGPGLALYGALTLAWLAGAGVVLRRRTSRPARDPERCPEGLRAKLEVARGGAGLAAGSVRVRRDAAAPFVAGLLRPVVVLPEAVLRQLPPPELEAVLIHEREHLRRRDPLRYGVLLLARAAFWFYPPIYWLDRRIREAAEMACDEAVLSRGVPAESYCRSLARTLSLGLACKEGLAPVGALGRPASSLRRRLERIRSGGRFQAMLRHRILVAAAIAAAVFLSVLPFSPVQQSLAGEPARSQREELNQLADAGTPIVLNFKGVIVEEILETVARAVQVDLEIPEELPDRLIDLDMETVALAEALERIGQVAGLRYRVLGPSRLEVRPLRRSGRDGVTYPVLIESSKIQPVYPPEAREGKVQGSVVLEAVIDRDGNVVRLRPLRVDPPDYQPFVDAAIEAVSQWQYDPAKQNGEPVDVYFTVVIEYALK